MRRVANVTGYRQILVLGSQAVHGALPDADLPVIMMMSEEADLAVVGDLSGEAPHVIEAAFGMGSPYHQSFGVYADGIALSEVALPDGWQGRVRTQQIDDSADLENPVTDLWAEVRARGRSVEQRGKPNRASLPEVVPHHSLRPGHCEHAACDRSSAPEVVHHHSLRQPKPPPGQCGAPTAPTGRTTVRGARCQRGPCAEWRMLPSSG